VNGGLISSVRERENLGEGEREMVGPKKKQRKKRGFAIYRPGISLVCAGFKISRNFNPYQPKVLGVKFSLREIYRIFPIEIRNFKLWEMPK